MQICANIAPDNLASPLASPLVKFLEKRQREPVWEYSREHLCVLRALPRRCGMFLKCSCRCDRVWLGQPPAAFFIHERRTLENVHAQFSGQFLEFMSGDSLRVTNQPACFVVYGRKPTQARGERTKSELKGRMIKARPFLLRGNSAHHCSTAPTLSPSATASKQCNDTVWSSFHFLLSPVSPQASGDGKFQQRQQSETLHQFSARLPSLVSSRLFVRQKKRPLLFFSPRGIFTLLNWQWITALNGACLLEYSQVRKELHSSAALGLIFEFRVYSKANDDDIRGNHVRKSTEGRTCKGCCV